MKLFGVDVGSTTVKAVCVAWRGAAEGEPSGFAKAWRGTAEGEPSGYKDQSRLQVLWQDYQRHNTRQAEKVLEFLGRMEDEAGVEAGRDRVFFTGSGARPLAPPPRAETPPAGGGPAAPARGGQAHPGGGGARRLRGASPPARALRVRDRRRGHEDDLLHPHRD